MKPYKVEVGVTNTWIVKVHANDEAEAAQIAEALDEEQIETNGSHKQLISIEAVNVELLELGDEDEDEESFSDLDIDPPGDVSTEPIEDAVIMPEDENDHSDQS